jgi:hypothetical protein
MENGHLVLARPTTFENREEPLGIGGSVTTTTTFVGFLEQNLLPIAHITPPSPQSSVLGMAFMSLKEMPSVLSITTLGMTYGLIGMRRHLHLP